ncbi:MAG: type II toxin-antitoxin system VapC family toxin [Acidobacteriota bacterium]|nr:type II toxin-antitoxin system VapC family toxin [Acidobacteriota bacterium]
MGGVVDTCIFVAAERRSLSLKELFRRIDDVLPAQRIVVSSITVAELVQGIYQGDRARSRKRMAYISNLMDILPIVPFSRETAWIAGRIRGEQAAAGNMLPFADSLIAASALGLEYSVLTHNVKDFARIPGLRVIAFTLP